MSAPPLQLRARRLSGVVSTDDILPARYKHSTVNPAELAPHVFENLLPGFAATLRGGDALVSDATFGIGSSREQAVSSLLAAGVRAVGAPSFGRIFFRNAWNLGLVAVEIPEFSAGDGEAIELDLEGGTVRAGGRVHRFRPIPGELLDTVRAGGLLARIRKEQGG